MLGKEKDPNMQEARHCSQLQKGKQRSLREKQVKFPHELVFNEMVKDGDSNEIVHFLRRQSVDIDVNKTNNNGTIPLNDLIKSGNLKCVRTLVSLGADVNRKDEQGWTPLHHAVHQGSFLLVKCLLESNADPEIQDNHGLSPADYSEDFEMIELLTSYSTQLSNEAHLDTSTKCDTATEIS